MCKDLFSRKQKKSLEESEQAGNFLKVSPADMARYEFEDLLYQKIFETEAALHDEENPMKIAVRVMQTCCEFYEADWCGILTVDLQTQAFTPEIWYEPGLGAMKPTLFNDIEFTEEFATWAQHLIAQKPLIIPDTEKLKEADPKEYAAYQRLNAHSILGVPFGQHPLGFMVARNVKRYGDKPEPLQLACFVAMMMVEQVRRLRTEKLLRTHEEDDGKLHIRYNILGPHNVVINGHEIFEQDFSHPNRRAWIILLYMVLHHIPVDSQKLIADNWPDDPEAKAKVNLRQAIYRLHQEIASYHDIKMIYSQNGMLYFSDDVKITTDADEMEDLYKRSLHKSDDDDKLVLLKKAFSLYRGRLFAQGEAEVGLWLGTYTAHYNQVFIDITTELLKILGHHKDNRCIMDYGPQALEIEPGIQAAYYWIIVAADGMGNSISRDMYLQKAYEELTGEEFDKLLKLLGVSRQQLEKMPGNRKVTASVTGK